MSLILGLTDVCEFLFVLLLARYKVCSSSWETQLKHFLFKRLVQL